MEKLVIVFILLLSFRAQAKSCTEAKISIEVEYFHFEERGPDIVLNKEFAPLHNNWSSAYPELGKLKISQNKVLEVALAYKDKEGKVLHKGSIHIVKDGTSTTELRDFLFTATAKAPEGKLVLELKEGATVLCQESMEITTITDQ